MTLSEALKDVEIAFLQLEFAIKLLSFCELGNIEPSKFDTDHIVTLEPEPLHFPTGHFSDSDSINRAASICVGLAFGASALVLDKAFDIMGMKPNPEATDAAVRLRTLIYMVRCAYAHGLADPRWEVRDRYVCTLNLSLDGIAMSLDLSRLNGESFEFEHIGGYLAWYRVRDAAVRVLCPAAA